MISIARGTRPAEICTEIRMQRQKHKGIFLLLEGAGDWKRLEKFINPQTTLALPCHGKSNVFDAIEITQNRGFEDCLGMIDSDFDRINKCQIENEDIILSNFHDFDMDTYSTNTISDYCNIFGNVSKINSLGGMTVLIDTIIRDLKPLSALRFANEKQKLEYSLSDIDIGQFFDGHSIDITEMINAVSYGKFDTSEHRDALREHVNRYMNADFELWQFTNGHDLAAAVGIALRSKIGERSEFQTRKQTIEADLRAMIGWPHLEACGLVDKISAWQTSRGHAPILRTAS